MEKITQQTVSDDCYTCRIKEFGYPNIWDCWKGELSLLCLRTCIIFFLIIFFQIDFPSHAFDIEYKIPQAAKTTVHHSVETLEKPLRERLLAILSKDSTIGYVHLF